MAKYLNISLLIYIHPFTEYKPWPYPTRIPDGNTVLLFTVSCPGDSRVNKSMQTEMMILDLVFTGS